MRPASGKRTAHEVLSSSSTMNILYATDFHNRANSGIAFAVNDLAGRASAELAPHGSVNLVSVGDTDLAIQPGVRHLKAQPSKSPLRMWRFASSYRSICETTIRQAAISIVHVHGIWMYPQFAATQAAQRSGIPTVLTNHGAVQWALRQPGLLGAAKKRLYMTLMRDRLFRKITVLHAITPMDRDALHSVFPHQRIEVIPNFVDLQKVDREIASAVPTDGAPYVLFLGRIHPTKGIDVLIGAFDRAALPREWRLIIVGPTADIAYADRIRRLVGASSKADRIEIRGPLWDMTAKYRLMRDARIAVVPSHTEAISLVNLECSACYTPTITTNATGLSDWAEGGGILVEPAIEPLANALSASAHWSDDERVERGKLSRQLVERRYSAGVVVPRWMDLYRSVC